MTLQQPVYVFYLEAFYADGTQSDFQPHGYCKMQVGTRTQVTQAKKTTVIADAITVPTHTYIDACQLGYQPTQWSQHYKSLVI